MGWALARGAPGAGGCQKPGRGDAVIAYLELNNEQNEEGERTVATEWRELRGSHRLWGGSVAVFGLKGSQSWEARALEPGCNSTGP